MASASCFELDRISFYYDRKPALRDVSLTLPPGRFYGLVGPNGCGKTTLIDILMGSRPPADGAVRYRDKEVGTYRRRDLAREIALVPQEFAVRFGFTVLEAVLMGRHPYIPRFGNPTCRDLDIASEAMDEIGIGDFANRPVTRLSGGEKQRVVVARALTQQTPVLILDEATSNLDIRYTLLILDAVRKAVKEQGNTVIAVMHDLNLAAAYCDELIIMREGRIHGYGPTAEVLTPGAIREVFGVEAAVERNDFTGARQISYRYGGAE